MLERSERETEKMKKKPELLAPCGSPEALIAAIDGGADAVYLGGKLFNARMNAKNFDDGALKDAVALCHGRGVRLYVTLNTQIYDREMKRALEYAAFLYGIGVDAIIIADLGLASLIHAHIPGLEMHASTQATCHSREAAEHLRSLGFTRMVANRESSREQLAAMVKDCAPTEIEAFVHGAICVSCSGQCMLSAVMGGRSGNRGECAQPCRMNYNGGNPISLKDMCLAEHIPELCEMGIASLKIEGRMKSPSYVYGVTRIYRRLLDEERGATPEEMKTLARLFSRDGFTDGYYTGKIGQEMLGVRSEKEEQAQGFTPKKDSPSRLPRIEVGEREKPVLPENLGAPKKRPVMPIVRTARFLSAKGIPKSDYFDIVYLPLGRFEGNAANGVVMPPVLFDNERDEAKRKLEYAAGHGAKHILLANLGQLSLAEEFGLIPHADYRFNAFNAFTASAVSEMGKMQSVILSPELILPQVRDIALPEGVRKGLIAYGRYPLMYLEKPVGLTELRDRKNARFPIRHDGKRDILYNSVPVYMADVLDRITSVGVEELHFLFSTEDSGEALRVIYAYQHAVIPKDPIRRIK